MSEEEIEKGCNYQKIQKLIGLIGPVNVPSLTRIISLPIWSGYFPDEWKMSKVLPLNKKDILSLILATSS